MVHAHPLVTRAMRNYFDASGGPPPDQPSSTDSGVEQADGRKYVVLRNGNGVLAVYRVRRDGALRRLRRYPSALNDW